MKGQKGEKGYIYIYLKCKSSTFIQLSYKYTCNSMDTLESTTHETGYVCIQPVVRVKRLRKSKKTKNKSKRVFRKAWKKMAINRGVLYVGFGTWGVFSQFLVWIVGFAWVLKPNTAIQ